MERNRVDPAAGDMIGTRKGLLIKGRQLHLSWPMHGHVRKIRKVE